MAMLNHNVLTLHFLASAAYILLATITSADSSFHRKMKSIQVKNVISTGHAQAMVIVFPLCVKAKIMR